MIRSFQTGFLKSSRSFITIAAIVIYGGLFLSKILNQKQLKLDGWYYIFPLISDPLWITLICFTWLLAWILRRAVSSSRDIELVRAGSFKKLWLLEMANIYGSLFAFLFLMCACFLGIGTQLGLDSHWAKDTFGGSVQISAYSSEQFANWFNSPVAAFVATLLFSIFGLASVAQLIMVLAVTRKLRLAVLVSTVMWLWFLISSFSPLSLTPLFDGSNLISLGWALSNPAGLTIAIGWWGLIWLVSAVILSSSGLTKTIQQLLSERLWVTLCCFVLAFVLSINSVLKTEGSYAAFVSQIFAGPFTDLIGFLLQATIPLIISTALLARFIEMKNGYLDLQLIRVGKISSWIRKESAREIVWAGVTIAALSPLILLVGLRSYGLPDSTAVSHMLRGLFGLFSVTTLQIALVFAIFRHFQNMSTAWLGFVAVALLTGYWFPNVTSLLTFVVPAGAQNNLHTYERTWSSEILALLLSSTLLWILQTQSNFRAAFTKNKKMIEGKE